MKQELQSFSVRSVGTGEAGLRGEEGTSPWSTWVTATCSYGSFSCPLRLARHAFREILLTHKGLPHNGIHTPGTESPEELQQRLFWKPPTQVHPDLSPASSQREATLKNPPENPHGGWWSSPQSRISKRSSFLHL